MPELHRIKFTDGRQNFKIKIFIKSKYYVFALCLFMSVTIYSQVPAVSGVQWVECGGMNGNHKPSCSSYNRGAKSSVLSGRLLNLKQEIMLNIFSGLLNNALNNNNKSNAQKLEQEKCDEEIRQQQLAILLAKHKWYNDSIAQANHDRMMKGYKPLEGSRDLSYKGLNDKPKITPVHFNFKITSFSGKVMVVKSNGQQIALSETQ